MWLIAPSVAFALPGSDAAWEILAAGDPQIECTTADGEPWCRSTSLVALPIEKVADALEHMAAYQDRFDSILRIDTLEPDTYRIVLDYPFPLSDRDYVARYTRTTDGEARVYRWEPVAHPNAPAEDGIVRLPKMAGEWRLVSQGGATRVTYLWHAEIAGSFPDAGLSTARKTAGKEAIKDIRKAAGG